MSRNSAIFYVSAFFGLWLIASPFLSSETKCAMIASDCISGFLVILFSLMRRPWSIACVGLWLQLAPLFFWATSSTTYATDTFIGAALIIASVILPEEKIEKSGNIPPRMDHNPSSWSRRVAIAFLALGAHLSARYMASYQLGYIDTIWDPVFDDGKGTWYVITSDISKMFPVSDAGLGAFAYMMELLLVFKGDDARWRKMPWVVACFGFLVVPVGIVSSLLIFLQPVVVGHLCFWCLLTAFFMLIMVILTVGEVKAMYRFVKDSMKQGKSFNKLFWQNL